MKKFLLLVALATTTVLTHAQKGNNQIGLAFEVGFAQGDFGDEVNPGLGGLLKGLYGVGKTGQVTLTTGYSNFKWKVPGDYLFGNSWFIPIVAGYRHNLGGFYVEPQAGYAIVGEKYRWNTPSTSPSPISYSNGAFAWGAGIGYAKKGFEGGVRYQGFNKVPYHAFKEGAVSMIVLHVGLNFTIGAKY